jgi:group II intron reverse transcriptase/maturase
MPKANTILTVYQQRGSQNLPLEGVYRRLFDPEFYLRAYGKIYRNAGAMTKGATRETVDAMDLQKINGIIELLRQERYRWTPARRTEIPKANGKMRPLGIPTWSDKLLQEVLRTLLESYYEPKFSNFSHGFRPSRGCHTALFSIQKSWKGTAWFIEGDIKGCFDNIDHQILLDILRRDLHDGRLLRLIGGLLRAGYLKDWKYHETISGSPQGGIISPLLSNIYLDQLDKFVTETLIPEYTRGTRRRTNPEYVQIGRALARARKAQDGQTITRLKRELRHHRSNDPMDPDYRRLRYVRYADDFLLGFSGPKNEAEVIRDRLAQFLRDNLKLELSIEKTIITHAVTATAKFLGYEITATQANTCIDETGRRSANGNIALLMPRKVVTKYRNLFSSNGKILHRPELTTDKDYTIINRYQSVLKGLYNYYCMATNVAQRMDHIKYILKISLIKTLAAKHRLSAGQTFKKYRGLNKVDNLRTIQVVVQRPNKEPLVAVFGGFPFKRNPKGLGTAEFEFRIAWTAPAGSRRAEIIDHLLSDKCTICGAIGPIQMHHIRALKDLNKTGQNPKPRWMQLMSARKRKSLAVCPTCHKDIHAGRHDGPRLQGSLESRMR